MAIFNPCHLIVLLAIFGSYRTSHFGHGANYDEQFKSYVFRRMSWRWERRVLRGIVAGFLPKAQDARYLDFACGTGRVLAVLENEFVQATGVDISATMLHVARRKVSSAHLVRADITREAVFAQGQFDLVTAFRFFANAEPALRLEAMEKVHELLRPDGYFVFNNHKNCTSLTFRLGRLKSKLRGKRPSFRNCWHERDVLALCHHTGFEVVKVYHWGILPGYENVTVLPEWLQYPLERTIVASGLGRSLATYQVYVCRHRGRLAQPVVVSQERSEEAA